MPKIAPNLASKPTTATATAATTTTTTTTTTKTTSAPTPSPPTAAPGAPALTNEPAWLAGITFKAANERTFATQRAKKAADRAKGKAPPRKPPSSSITSTSSSTFSQAHAGAATATMTSIWAEIWDARSGKTSADDLDWPELPTPLSLSQRYCSSPSPASSPAPTGYTPLRPTQDREVPLSALVRPVKPRGAKAKECEFELLPPVKNVIALDDAESNVPDEPWEYISSVGGDDEARKIFSYAEIVSKSA